jgi:SPP1 family predicted phage head-tail adaptor
MSYGAGMRQKRIHIFNQKSDVEGEFGRNSGGRGYEYTATVWAAVTFNKGMKSMREGAVDAYDTVMFRMLYTKKICRKSMIAWDDRTFTIQSFNRDYQTNEIQITAVEAPGKDLAGLVPVTAILTDSNGNALETIEGDILVTKTPKKFVNR